MDVLERARKNEAIVFSAISAIKQVEISRKTDLSEPAISLLKSEGHFSNVCSGLAACGLKIVPENYECYSEEYIAGLEETADMYRKLTRKLRRQAKEVRNLEEPRYSVSWDDYD